MPSSEKRLERRDWWTLFPEYNPYFERQVASAWEKTRGLAARV